MAIDSGMTVAAATRIFRVSRATIRNYVNQRRERGSLLPRRIPGRSPRIRPEDYSALMAQLEAAPEAALSDHCRAWERKHGVRVSISTMQRTIARTGWKRRRSA